MLFYAQMFGNTLQMQNVDRLIRLFSWMQRRNNNESFFMLRVCWRAWGGLVNPRVDLHSMFSESKNNRFSP